MWTFSQSTGELKQDGEADGRRLLRPQRPRRTRKGRNNPDLEALPNIGPIPRGRYTIGTP